MTVKQRKLFGTDGIRGRANSFPMTVEIAQKLGQAAGLYFCKQKGRRHQALIGKDTRRSGYMIENAIISGLLSAGMDVFQVGPMPTPAVALLTRSLRADVGIMISASHNPFSDNGIKLFGPDGYKLSDETEITIEEMMSADNTALLAGPEQIGRADRIDDAAGRYIEIAKSTFPRGLKLNGMKIVLDCANGAAYKVAPKILWELGAEVITIGVEPNGYNINKDCGSTHPEKLQKAVLEHKAACGIALDGDADRVVLVDENGEVVNGDHILASIATYLHKKGQLTCKSVIATEMSNLGLEDYLAGLKLSLQRTKVGDRYVLERMREINAELGGEQSGHIILSNHTTTGDGLIASIQVLAMMVDENVKASSLRRFTPYPQLLKSIPFKAGMDINVDDYKSLIIEAEKKLGSQGRVSIRKSGTEPLIRVMVEAKEESLVQTISDELVSKIKKLIA